MKIISHFEPPVIHVMGSGGWDLSTLYSKVLISPTELLTLIYPYFILELLYIPKHSLKGC